LKYPFENSTEHTTAATRKSEAAKCKIRKEADKNCEPSSNLIKVCDFNLCVIKQTIMFSQ